MTRSARPNPLTFEIPPAEPEAVRLARRAKGLEARHAAKLARKPRTCRYVSVGAGLCTGEAVDQEADVLLCQKHLGRVLEVYLPPVYAKVRADLLATVAAACEKALPPDLELAA
jgi:hypothetical protein